MFISECSGNQRPCLAEKKDESEAKPPKFRVPSFGPSELRFGFGYASKRFSHYHCATKIAMTLASPSHMKTVPPSQKVHCFPTKVLFLSEKLLGIRPIT